MASKKLRAIARIEQTKKLYTDGVALSPYAFVLDLLTDLHHYCAFQHIDITEAATRAEFLYRQESKT